MPLPLKIRESTTLSVFGMKKAIRNNQMGVSEWVLPVSGVEAVLYAAKIGFDGIQLGDQGGARGGYKLLKKQAQETFIEAATVADIEFQALHLYTLVREGTMKYPLSSPQGESAKESILAGIEACAAMAVPELFLTSGMACQIENEEDFNNTAKIFKFACRAGAEKGVRIVFESILPANEILRMIDAVGEELRVCYDIFNPIRFNSANPLEEIPKLSHVVDHYHLKDAPKDLIGCCLLGDGCGQFFEVVKRIQNTGYMGWLISENYYAQPPMSLQGSPDELARKDLETMRNIGLADGDPLTKA